MKKVLFVLTLALVFSVSHAQVKFGIKAGINTAQLKLDEASNLDQVIREAKDAKWGFHAGAFVRIKILMLYLQPEVYFTSTGGNFTFQDGATAEAELHSFDLNRLDIPILLGAKLGPVRLNVGPTGQLTLSSKSSLESLEADVKSMVWGYQAGLGFDLFKKLTIDARYEGNLSKLGESITIGGAEFTTNNKTSQFLISVGFMF